MAYTSTFLVSNIHCPSCVSYVQDVLREVPAIESVHVSLIDHTIRVKHAHDKTQEVILKELITAAFEVQHVTTTTPKNIQSHDYDVSPSPVPVPVSRPSWLMSRAQRKHIANCKACQRKRAQNSLVTPSGAALVKFRRSKLESINSINDGNGTQDRTSTADSDEPAGITIDGKSDDEPTRYVANVSIGGMTCASCSSTLTKELNSLGFVESADVNLMTNHAKVVFRAPKSNSAKIVDAIEDVGYEATIDEAFPLVQENLTSQTAEEQYKVSLSIEGMTCGSCVGTITRGLQELPFVDSVNIDLVGNRGLVSFHGRKHLEAILDKVDDLGYGSTVVEVVNTAEQSRPQEQQRTVQIKIDGMYCEHCPENIRSSLHTALPPSQADGGLDYVITKLPTLKDPLITIAYWPSPPEFTVRSFISTINNSHEAFISSVYHPPTLEERSRRVQRKEEMHLLWRLAFTAAVAIPTFIIGVVYMSLVPQSNSTRRWLEEPILAGDAMRMEWALFFMTTPVMFFGTDIFHTRALKEIRSMWRPKSRVPLLRRFYRFGSMNLLISAGASVAYFSSLAILIMDATTKSMSVGKHRSSNTYFDTVTFLTFFILIGRYLEAYSKTKTGDAVAMLSSLRPCDALLVRDGSMRDQSGETTQKIPVDQLEVGDLVQIPYGSSPPTDGTVAQQGMFLFDESSLTGESKPVKKAFGDKVYTGSVNASEPVRIKVTEVGGTSMLDQIVNVVREGQAKRAPVERIADVLTGYFVPVITLIAIVTWVIWLALGQSGTLPQAWLDVSQGGWAFWSLEFAIAVFVVACPCGIGLAAPTALFVGGGLAAKRGILVQGGGEAFQEASRLDTIVFDKTGTLTEGHMRVTDFEMLQSPPEDIAVDEAIILAMSRIMEESSTHPIATAIATYCGQKMANVSIEQEEVKEIPGQGMSGIFSVQGSSTVTRYEAVLGNGRLLRSIWPRQSSESVSDVTLTPTSKDDAKVTTHEFYLNPTLQKHQSLGHSTAIFAIRKLSGDLKKITAPSFRPVAVFAIADPIRSEAPSVLQSLRNSQLEVHMCTGDNQITALAIASQLGIPVSNVRAGVLPQGKAAYISELQGVSSAESAGRKDRRKIVAFVGDGTNDTPALSAADVSIALSSGSDVAITTASFILLNSDLNTILVLVRLAKRVFLRVKLNFVWAAVYNLCLVPVAAGVFFPIGASDDHGGWRLGPVWASMAMAASSVSVVMSSLALKLPELRWPKS